jgi:dolichol-phosphate mannosyltransferase
MKMNNLVIIPTYNEAGNIYELMNTILSTTNYDILIVDDGSLDGTLDLVEKLMTSKTSANRVHLLNRGSKFGVGSAHKAGLIWALERDYSFATTMDGDWTHDPSYISMLVELLVQSNSDIVIGSRFISKDSLKEWTLWRRLVTHIVRLLTKFSLGIPFDNSSGYRCHLLTPKLKGVLSEIQSDHYDYFFESLIIFSLNDMKINQLGIKLLPRHQGSSKLTLRLAFSALRTLLRLSIEIRAKKFRH